MRRVLLLACVPACLSNPKVEVDHDELAMPRGTSRDLVVTVDGQPELKYLVWTIDDERIASVTPSLDGVHVYIGGKREGETVIHLNSHGETFDIPTRVDPPVIVQIWIEPSAVVTNVGSFVHFSATALDTALGVRDISRTGSWTVRDPSLAHLDMAGMMLEAMGEGETALNVSYGDHAAQVPVTIIK